MGTTFYIRVGGYGGERGTGTLLLTEVFGPAGPDCLTPDAFEDNDDCASATPLGVGSGQIQNTGATDTLSLGIDLQQTLCGHRSLRRCRS